MGRLDSLSEGCGNCGKVDNIVREAATLSEKQRRRQGGRGGCQGGGDIVRGAGKYNNGLVVSVLPKNFPVFGYYIPEWGIVRVMCCYTIKGFL